MSEADKGVTVVIPAYNAAAFIEKALGSVADQTRPADEVIVVDDASTDDTAAVADRWTDRLPLRVIRCDNNAGAATARKIAIEAATQPYIANLDADDRWLPEHLATAMPLVEPDTMVSVRCIREREDGSGGRSIDPTSVPDRDDQVTEILRRNFLFSGAVYPAAPLLDPSIGHSLVHGAEDWDTWIRLIVLAGVRAELAPEPTVVKVGRVASVSSGAQYINADLEVYRSLAADPRYEPWHHLLDGHIRRRRARARMLQAVEEARAGRHWSARRGFASAALLDRSLRGGLQAAAGGSVLLRALVGVVAPARFVRWRDAKAARDGVIAGGG